MTKKKTIADLIEVMAALRTPKTGCPWDLEQDFRSIAPYTLEEAYEVADAIERDNLADLKEELGDLLLQVVYHARMAEEQSVFDFDDVADVITKKMIRRHPHVFGSEAERAAGAQDGWWDRIKEEERAEKGQVQRSSKVQDEDARLLASVPVGLPALTRARKLQSKAAKVGFDWPSLAPVFEKMKEELTELEGAALPLDPRGDGFSVSDAQAGKIAEELGDVLFVIANVARHLKVDPEQALRAANQKFCRRFAFIEDELRRQGKTLEQSDLTEMDRLWDEAKAREASEKT